MGISVGIKIDGSGRVNDVEFTAVGHGLCDTGTGRISFGVNFSRLATGSHPLANLLGVLILPTVFGREHGEAENLLTLTGGNFQFIQVMTGDGIDVASKGEMSRTGDEEVTWRSEAQGVVRLVDVSPIETFAAVMLPRGPGHVIDVLAIPLVEKGRRMVLHAIRDFKFEPTAALKRHQIRQISVVPNVESLSVNVAITSDIFIFPGSAQLEI
jgi:hypothetical protein